MSILRLESVVKTYGSFTAVEHGAVKIDRDIFTLDSEDRLTQAVGPCKEERVLAEGDGFGEGHAAFQSDVLVVFTGKNEKW